MINRKTASVLKLAALPIAALVAYNLSAGSLSAGSMTALVAPAIAQTPGFSVPESVPKGTKVQVSSSDNMNSIAQALKGGFESQYSNASVSVDNKDASAAIQDVRSGKADLAAISRPLSAEEKAQGLVDKPVRREKIAIIVGKDNPFAQSITGSQFAQMFRGEIANWKEVGGPDKPIRFIDRPATSETRQALQPYPVFVSQPFKTGSNATQSEADDLGAIASELSDDGISYALVGQLEGQSDVKAIQLHKTLPDDPRYPFSQPYSFVYAGGASPAVQAFLGYATGAPGQATLDSAALSGYAVAPAAGTAAANTGTDSAAAGADGVSAAANADGTAAAGAAGSTIDPTTGNSIAADGTVTDADGNVVTLDETETTIGEVNGADGVVIDGDSTADAAGRGRWWWLLLPLAGLALLIWAASKRGTEEKTGYIANADRDDDTIRTNYRGGADDARYATSEVGGKADAGIGRAVAGGTALAGGAAVAGTGLASRAGSSASRAGDVTMDLDDIKTGAQTGIDSVSRSPQGGLGNLRSNIQSGVGSTHGSIDGGVDGVRGDVQGGIDSTRGNLNDARGSMQGSIDDTRTKYQGGVDNVKGSASEGSWLDRAKQRINEASEQVKDTTADIKDDVTGNDNK